MEASYEQSFLRDESYSGHGEKDPCRAQRVRRTNVVEVEVSI